jgi:hypothetical protein
LKSGILALKYWTFPSISVQSRTSDSVSHCNHTIYPIIIKIHFQY